MKPTSRSRNKSINHLFTTALNLSLIKKKDGIVFLCIDEDKNQISLRDSLIEDEILVFDKNLAEDIRFY